MNVGGEDTAGRGNYKKQHCTDKRLASSVPVAQGSENQLSSSESDESGGKAELDQRGGTAEPILHRRENRNVHIHDERAESAERSQKHQDEGARVNVFSSNFHRNKIN